MIIYVYDLNAKDAKEYNRIKRRFYYELRKILHENTDIYWKNKSVLICPEGKDVMMDLFFKRYKKYLTGYKIIPEVVEEL